MIGCLRAGESLAQHLYDQAVSKIGSAAVMKWVMEIVPVWDGRIGCG
jgi:hypothetical protein